MKALKNEFEDFSDAQLWAEIKFIKLLLKKNNSKYIHPQNLNGYYGRLLAEEKFRIVNRVPFK